MSQLLLSLYLVLPQPVHAASVLETAQNSFEVARTFRDQQMNQLQGLFEDLYRLKKKGLTELETNKGSIDNIEIRSLEARIKYAAAGLDSNIGRVTTSKENSLEDIVWGRRKFYLQELRKTANLPEGQIKAMNLSGPIAQDLKFLKSVKDLSPEDFDKRLNYYEGRNFGQKVTESDLTGMGVKKTGKVSIDTYHSKADLDIKGGQYIRLQTPAGTIQQGQVFGVAPDGRVLVRLDFPPDMEGVVPPSESVRLLDLNKAQTVHLFSSKAQSLSAPGNELEVRFSYRQISKAVNDNLVISMGAKKSADGNVERFQVQEQVMDRRMGERIIPEMGAMFGGGDGSVSF